MMYASLCRRFDPDRDAGPHPQLLSALLFSDNYRASGTLTLVQADTVEQARYAKRRERATIVALTVIFIVGTPFLSMWRKIDCALSAAAAPLAAKPAQQRRVAPAEGEIIIAADTNVMAQKKPGPNIFWIFRRPGYLYETL